MSAKPLQFSLVIALAVCAATGAAFGLAFPRGPQSGLAAAFSIVAGLAAGALVGRFHGGRRWYLLVIAWAAYEIVRLPIDTPSTNAPSLGMFRGSSYALGALALGRGVDLALGLVPLAVGLAIGRLLAARASSGGVAAGRVRRVAAPVALILLVAVAVVALVPARTPAPAGGIAEVARVPIGGCEHRLVIRGASADQPVIFFLSGGPGGTEIGTIRNQWGDIEREFTVVVWDQTGAGLQGRCFPRDGGLTFDRVRGDAISALEWTNERFGRKPILVGNSWGTFLGVLVAQQRPDLIAAYVGTGQMVDLAETDKLFYADTLEWARASGRADLVTRLEAQGPPPYDSMYPYEPVFTYETAWHRWERTPGIPEAVNPLANVMDKPELDPIAKVRYPVNLIDTFSVLYPQMQGIDFRRDVPRLDVPVYLAVGEHEVRGRAVLVRPWFEQLEAPHKEWIDFPRSGHKAFGEEPGPFLGLLRRVAAAAG